MDEKKIEALGMITSLVKEAVEKLETAVMLGELGELEKERIPIKQLNELRLELDAYHKGAKDRYREKFLVSKNMVRA